MTGGETRAHVELKALAFEWARANGLPIAGCEVRIPKSGYRADVAAASRHPAGESGRVALFECKQARSDFLRDEADEPAIRQEAAALTQRLGQLRALIAVHRPDLRRGVALFAEFDEYDLAGLRHDTFHGLERELEILQRKIHSCVKFARLHKYLAADHLYLVTEPGIMELHEVPAGWGWLVRNEHSLELRQLPERHPSTTERRVRLAGVHRDRRGAQSRPRDTALRCQSRSIMRFVSTVSYPAMMLLRLLGLAPFATFGLAVTMSAAGPSVGANDPSIAAVMAADRARGAALLAADTKALGSLLADDFRYTHSNGHLETKEIHIGTFVSGLRYTRFTTSNVVGHVVTPDVVVLNGSIDQSKGKDGKVDEAKLLFQAVWRKKAGAWQIVSLQTAKPPPVAAK